MVDFTTKVKLLNCLSSRRCLSIKKFLLCGVICVFLYTIFHKFNLLEFPGRKMKKDLHDEDEVAVEGIDHVDNDDKVKIAIVDQHQEGIHCFFFTI